MQVFEAFVKVAQEAMTAVREGRITETERMTVDNDVVVVRHALTRCAAPEPHPDLLKRCRRCGFIALEHDAYDMACPDDEDHARLNREDGA